MKHLATAALGAALLAGVSGAALAQAPTTGPASPAPAATPAAPAPAKTAAHPAMRHLVHYQRDRSGDPDTRALNLLEANGYTDIKSFSKVGAAYQASVEQNGKMVTVTVDPATGKLTKHV